METLWKVLSSLVVLFFFGLCNGLPINLENSGPDPHTQLLTGLIAVLLTICSVVLLVGCVCCQRKNGFEDEKKQEFRNSPVASSATIVNSSQDHGHVNPIANSSSEFTIFTPISPPHHNNNVFLANQRIVSCSQEDYKDGDIDASLWFDGSEKDFPRTKLKYIRELGKGWFGRVVEGTAQNVSGGSDDQEWTPVVVRILEASATSRERLVFLNDATIYKCGYHPNILRLLGRSLDTVPLLLLQEYSPHGDLKKYLRMCKSSQDKLVAEDMPLRWCYQLTLALNFLHDQKLTHPDLSARNCQLSQDLSLKLGDYGLSAVYYPEDYYQGSPGVPLRWCAPEIISYTSTTIQTTPTTAESNVWALGVTMWEILEWGEQPYAGLTDDEVISQVLGTPKVRLQRPTYHLIYTDYMYKIMQSCWYSSDSRVTARQIELMMTDLMHVFENTKVSFKLNSDISSAGEAISLEDFDSRWNSMKPNSPLGDDATALEPLQPNEEHQKSDRAKKSASLNNLHGSLDNLLSTRQFDPMESWLENIASDTSDMSFVRGLSEAITDLDNAIAMENMCSSPEFGKANMVAGGQTTSSESETEDENWRKKIERGAYTEKVRQKSRSVADLMVLTHIDCSESDSETLPSLDYKVNQRVRYLKSVDNQKKFGSEGNLFNVQDNTFQEELKKLQEERRDSLLFVPDKFSECSFSEEGAAAPASVITPSSLSNNRLDSLENSPVKKLMEELNSPSEIVPQQQVYNVFNVSVRHVNVGGAICDKTEGKVERKDGGANKDIADQASAFNAICDRPVESKVLEQNEVISVLKSDNNQNNPVSVTNMNQNLKVLESKNHIKTVFNPFEDSIPTSSNFQDKYFNEMNDIDKDTQTYPYKNNDSDVISNIQMNSTNDKTLIGVDKAGKSSGSQSNPIERRNRVLENPEVAQNENILNQHEKEDVKATNDFAVKIEVLNEHNSTPTVQKTCGNTLNNFNNDIPTKEIVVTSKENNKNVKLKVPKLSEIIQRNAIDYKVHHHHNSNNEKASVLSKSEESEKLVHQEIIDKDSGLNTPENSASLERLYDDNEEILDVGSFDSDRSNETNNKGTLLTDISNDEETNYNEKKEFSFATSFQEDQKISDREEEISNAIDFCIQKDARLMCDLFLSHERINVLPDLKNQRGINNITVENASKKIIVPYENISENAKEYSFLTYDYKKDMKNFIEEEIYHSSNLLKRLVSEKELSKHITDVKLSSLNTNDTSKCILVTNSAIPQNKFCTTIHQPFINDVKGDISSDICFEQTAVDEEVFYNPNSINETVYKVPELPKQIHESFVIETQTKNLVDENEIQDNNIHIDTEFLAEEDSKECDKVDVIMRNLDRNECECKTDFHKANDNIKQEKEIFVDDVKESVNCGSSTNNMNDSNNTLLDNCIEQPNYAMFNTDESDNDVINSSAEFDMPKITTITGNLSQFELDEEVKNEDSKNLLLEFKCHEMGNIGSHKINSSEADLNNYFNSAEFETNTNELTENNVIDDHLPEVNTLNENKDICDNIATRSENTVVVNDKNENLGNVLAATMEFLNKEIECYKIQELLDVAERNDVLIDMSNENNYKCNDIDQESNLLNVIVNELKFNNFDVSINSTTEAQIIDSTRCNSNATSSTEDQTIGLELNSEEIPTGCDSCSKESNNVDQGTSHNRSEAFNSNSIHFELPRHENIHPHDLIEDLKVVLPDVKDINQELNVNLEELNILVNDNSYNQTTTSLNKGIANNNDIVNSIDENVLLEDGTNMDFKNHQFEAPSQQESVLFITSPKEDSEDKTENKLVEEAIPINDKETEKICMENANSQDIQSTNFIDKINEIEPTAIFLIKEIENYAPQAVQGTELNESDTYLAGTKSKAIPLPYHLEYMHTQHEHQGVALDDKIEQTAIFLSNEIKNYANTISVDAKNDSSTMIVRSIIEEIVNAGVRARAPEEAVSLCEELENDSVESKLEDEGKLIDYHYVDSLKSSLELEKSKEIEETSIFLRNEVEHYNNGERKVDFDVSDTQEKISLNSLTHLSTFTSTPFANRRPNESTVILGASDDYSIDYYSGLKTSIDPEEGGDLQLSSNFVRQNNTNDLYSLETWDNFLGRSFDEQQSAAIDFNDFSHEPHSLLFLECGDEQEKQTDELPMTKVLEETYNAETLPVLENTFVKGKNEENANATFDVSIDNENDKKESQKNVTSTGTGGGWFLHPQSSAKESSNESSKNKESTPTTSASTSDESYVGFSMDDEIMAAIRNELLTKLPHAQRASSDHQIEENGEEMDSTERNEVFLRYNVYNTPLSPIPEESCDSDIGSGAITPKRINDTSDDEGNSSDWSIQEDNNSSNARTEEIISPKFLESPARFKTDLCRHTPSQDSCCSNDTLFNVEELNGGLNDKITLEPIFNLTIQLDNSVDSTENEGSDSKYTDCNVESQQTLSPGNVEISVVQETEQNLPELPVIRTEHNYILDFLDNERYSEMHMSLDAGEEISSTSDMYLTVSENTYSFGQNVAPLNSPEDRPWKELQASFRDCDQGEVEELEDCVISDEDIDKVLREDMESEMLSQEMQVKDSDGEFLNENEANRIISAEQSTCGYSEPTVAPTDAVCNNEQVISSADNIYVNLANEESDMLCDSSSNNIYANVENSEANINIQAKTTDDSNIYVNIKEEENENPPNDTGIYANLPKTESGESFSTVDSGGSESADISPQKQETALGYENLKTIARDDEDDLYSRVEEVDDGDKFSRFEDLFGPLTDIRFSGPGSSSQMMTTSFSESNDLGDDQDWDSGSDTRSSSSGEFIWKEGEHEASVKALRAPPQLEHVDYVTPMENIQEEETMLVDSNKDSSSSSSGSEGEDECPEFVPSAWDKYATPTKSALRSPEKTLERSKEEKIEDENTPKEKKSKGVWFKKQKYHCVYEYPREPESPVLQSYDLWKPTPDYATLSDWDLDRDVYLTNLETFENRSKTNNLPNNLYHINAFADVNMGSNALDEDFYVSSSSKPFDMLTGLTSQFFPGRQFPSDTWTDIINVTPDSGVEDGTPAPASFSGDETDGAAYGNKNKIKSQLTGVQSLKILAATAAERNGAKRELGGLRHTRDKLKLDLPPSPSAFTSNRTFSVDTAAEEIVTRQVPTFTTFGKSRFSVQHVDTPPDSERTDKNVSFEALPHKKPEPQASVFVDTNEWKQEEKERQKIESVRGEASLLDSADEDSGIESCTLDRKRFNI